MSYAGRIANAALLAAGTRRPPIGWLLLWPTWWGLWLAAGGVPPLWPLVVFTLGVWLTRSAGCVINDYADRWLDPQVERTRNHERDACFRAFLHNHWVGATVFAGFALGLWR
jgi:4-hydroxybenzoate polyprenyltransferase